MTVPFRPDLSRFRWIVVNSSGGKDSQTTLRRVVAACDAQSIPRERLLVSHQDLGECDWPGAHHLAHRQAAHYSLPVHVTAYRNRSGESLSLLDYVLTRGRWPSSKQRYCTSDFKRGPGGRVITSLYRQDPGDILQVFGFRAEESSARAKREEWSRNSRLSTKSRTVYDWLPIHPLSLDAVWSDIHASGVPHHPAYDLGLPRLSCVFCIFAGRKDLALAARHNPALLARYAEVERRIGHRFRQDLSLADLQSELQTPPATPHQPELQLT